jgi:hypothetical protein
MLIVIKFLQDSVFVADFTASVGQSGLRTGRIIYSLLIAIRYNAHVDTLPAVIYWRVVNTRVGGAVTRT